MKTKLNKLKNYLFQTNLSFIYVFSAILIAPLFSIVLSYFFSHIETYENFNVGYITFIGVSKFSDYMKIFGFVLGFFVSIFILKMVLNKLKEKRDVKDFKELLLYTFLPFLIWLGNTFFSNNSNVDLILISSLLSVLLILIYFIDNIEDRRRLFVVVFLCASFFTLSFFSVSLFLNRVLKINAFFIKNFSGEVVSYKMFLLFLLFFIILLFTFIKTKINMKFVLLVSQLFLPLFFFILIPAPFIENGGLVQIYPIQKSLYILIIGLILVSLEEFLKLIKKILNFVFRHLY